MVDLHLSNIFKDCNTSLINNGFCDDETNTAECNYDSGDCCGIGVDTQYCSECTCHNSNVSVSGESIFHTTSISLQLC